MERALGGWLLGLEAAGPGAAGAVNARNERAVALVSEEHKQQEDHGDGEEDVGGSWRRNRRQPSGTGGTERGEAPGSKSGKGRRGSGLGADGSIGRCRLPTQCRSIGVVVRLDDVLGVDHSMQRLGVGRSVRCRSLSGSWTWLWCRAGS